MKPMLKTPVMEGDWLSKRCPGNFRKQAMLCTGEESKFKVNSSKFKSDLGDNFFLILDQAFKLILHTWHPNQAPTEKISLYHVRTIVYFIYWAIISCGQFLMIQGKAKIKDLITSNQFHIQEKSLLRLEAWDLIIVIPLMQWCKYYEYVKDHTTNSVLMVHTRREQ